MHAITTTVTVSNRTIADLLCCALEGGSHYWIESAKQGKRGQVLVKPWGDEYTPNYIEAPFSGTLDIVISETVEGNDHKVTYTLDATRLKSGLEVMAKDYPHTFADVLTDSMDAETGDVFLQCCLFNKVVFG